MVVGGVLPSVALLVARYRLFENDASKGRLRVDLQPLLNPRLSSALQKPPVCPAHLEKVRHAHAGEFDDNLEHDIREPIKVGDGGDVHVWRGRMFGCRASTVYERTMAAMAAMDGVNGTYHKCFKRCSFVHRGVKSEMGPTLKKIGP